VSYDIKLTRPENTKIVEEQQVIESDNVTVVLERPMNNESDVTVRINDFPRDRNHKTETLVRENVTSQFSATNLNTIFVAQGPIYDGLKIGQLSTSEEDIIVKINIVEEEVSGQLTGIENFFFVEGRPILRSNTYDFNSLVTKNDTLIRINGNTVDTNNINDINTKTGRIELSFIPEATDIVTINYSFSAKIKEIDARNSKIILQEKPKLGQTVYVQYFARVNDGWEIIPSEKNPLENAKDIKFYKRKNTSRTFVQNENVSSQFNGSNKSFFTSNKPILPLFQNFSSTIDETLNNAVSVLVNGSRTYPRAINSSTGEITLSFIPNETDNVTVSYYYQSEAIIDRISVDYNVEKRYSEKSKGNINIADYKVDSLGNYEKVRNENKLIQDMRKIVVTTKGSDPVATWYGTNFTPIIGTAQLPEFVQTRIKTEITEALQRLKDAQDLQEEYQTVTDREALAFISNIEVTQSTVDPSYFRVVVDIVTQQGEEFTLDEPFIFDSDRMYEEGTGF